MSRPTWLLLSAIVLFAGVGALFSGPVRAGGGEPHMTVAQASPTPPPGGPSQSAVPSPGSGTRSADAGSGGPSALAGEGAEDGQQAYSYDPSGRREPFNPLVQSGKGAGGPIRTVPPLQRVGLTEMNLIGIIWGGFGYTAMVRTPDGKGYTIRRGTRIGPNNGVVTSITKNEIVVTERTTDFYGKEQEREYLKLLHPSEDLE